MLPIPQSHSGSSWRIFPDGAFVPLGLVLCEDLSLGVVTDDPDVNESSQVELLGSEHRHRDGVEVLRVQDSMIVTTIPTSRSNDVDRPDSGSAIPKRNAI